VKRIGIETVALVCAYLKRPDLDSDDRVEHGTGGTVRKSYPHSLESNLRDWRDVTIDNPAETTGIGPKYPNPRPDHNVTLLLLRSG